MTNLILPRKRKLIASSFAAGLAVASPAMGHNGGPPITDADVARVVDQNRHLALPWGTLPSDPHLAMILLAQFAQVRAVSSGGFTGTRPQDVFAVNTYTGTGATRSVTSGLDMSGQGGLVWVKGRVSAFNNVLYDTVRGAGKGIMSDSVGAGYAASAGNDLASFTSSGFTAGPTEGFHVNTSAEPFVSWSFRKATKFFDVKTWTGTGLSRTLAHSLGAKPEFIFIRRIDTPGYNWVAFFSTVTYAYVDWWRNYMYLDQTGIAFDWGNGSGLSGEPDSTNIYLGNDSAVNGGGGANYVGYFFANDTGPSGVVRVGTFTTDGSGNATVSSLGWKPQYALVKCVDRGDAWHIFDTTRGWGAGNDALLDNSTNAENATLDFGAPTSNGFTYANGWPSRIYAYLAIREPV